MNFKTIGTPEQIAETEKRLEKQAQFTKSLINEFGINHIKNCLIELAQQENIKINLS